MQDGELLYTGLKPQEKRCYMIKNARILKTIKEKLTKDENRYPLSSYKLGIPLTFKVRQR